MERLFLILSVFTLFSCSTNGQTVDNSFVSSLDLNRYLGAWYEIARFDHRFEKGLDYCKANYILGDNGKITLINSGMKNGEPTEVKGFVKTTPQEGLLRVSFFRPFYSDYRIFYVDPDYSYALIGSDSDKYLWILSRTPQLPNGAKEFLLDEIHRRGYDSSKLIWVKQS